MMSYLCTDSAEGTEECRLRENIDNEIKDVIITKMAIEIVVKSVIAAFHDAITGDADEKCTIVIAMAATVVLAVGIAISAVITAAIASARASAVSSSITAATAKAVKNAPQQPLHKAVKNIIGPRGISDLSKCTMATPSDMVVNKLSKEAIDKISPHLWVLTDPAFLRLTRLIRVLRAIQKGEEPYFYDDDDDFDEEECRLFKGPEVEGDSENFIFFTVFRSVECKEGDEVYSMSAQWKKLKSLVDDPVMGYCVGQLLRELFESYEGYVEEAEVYSSRELFEKSEGYVEEDEIDSSILFALNAPRLRSKKRRVATPVKKKPVKVPREKKVVTASLGEMVPFYGKTIFNVCGSSKDTRRSSWLKTYYASGYGKPGKCYIVEEKPEIRNHSNRQQDRIVGGHVWSPELEEADRSLYYYILPICKAHNSSPTYDKPILGSDLKLEKGWMKTSSDAMAMKISSTDKVVGWKGMLSHLISSPTSPMLVAATTADRTEGYHGLIKREQWIKWVLDEVNQVALECVNGPIETVWKEVLSMVTRKLHEITKSASTNAKSKGTVMLQSLIPLYGITQAIKRLGNLHSDSMDRFQSGAQSALSSYRDECVSDEEQKRREQRLIEEIDKVIASDDWKDSILAFEQDFSSKFPDIIEP